MHLAGGAADQRVYRLADDLLGARVDQGVAPLPIHRSEAVMHAREQVLDLFASGLHALEQPRVAKRTRQLVCHRAEELAVAVSEGARVPPGHGHRSEPLAARDER